MLGKRGGEESSTMAYTAHRELPPYDLGFRGFGFWGRGALTVSDLGVMGLGLRGPYGLGFRGLGFRVEGHLRFRVWGFRVQG